jgi:hypothetical protein
MKAMLHTKGALMSIYRCYFHDNRGVTTDWKPVNSDNEAEARVAALEIGSVARFDLPVLCRARTSKFKLTATNHNDQAHVIARHQRPSLRRFPKRTPG